MDHVEYMRLLRNGPIEKELPFTQEEYDERVAKVRAEMGKDGLDGLIVVSPANLHYLSGYYTFSISNLTALVIPADGEPGVVTASCEIPAAILVGVGGGCGQLCLGRRRFDCVESGRDA